MTPGILGGGGGGGSFVLDGSKNVIYKSPEGHLPFGDPPKSCGVGLWQEFDQPCGSGGKADSFVTNDGASGCVRIKLPGFY